MKILKLDPPVRTFAVGVQQHIEIKHSANINLESNEQITFVEGSSEYDVVRKSWGYYATPSVNDRLIRFGYKTALVQNVKGQVYIMIVDVQKLDEFTSYLNSEENFVLQWLDEIPLQVSK